MTHNEEDRILKSHTSAVLLWCGRQYSTAIVQYSNSSIMPYVLEAIICTTQLYLTSITITSHHTSMDYWLLVSTLLQQ